MKLKIIVLSGGPSAEHEISLKTGRMVAQKLDRNKYKVEELVVGRDGRWPTPPEKLKADVVFIAMHGEYGEDGTVQKILEDAGLTYTGSGVAASRLGMDKIKSAGVFKKHGLLVPEFEILKNPKKNYHSALSRGVVVKPSNRGSSVGVTIVEKPEQLPAAIKKAKRFSDSIIIQKFVPGREVTCGVIEHPNSALRMRPSEYSQHPNSAPTPKGLGPDLGSRILDGGRDNPKAPILIRDNLIALPPTEIIPVKSDFFNYEAKYTPGASREITPPDMPPEIIKTIQETALKAHKIIGCSGMSRTDMIVETSNLQPPTSNIYVLEINTIPGMTETSLLPQEAKAMGISFPELLDKIIQSALNKAK